jgi:hypothetical protein
MGGSQKARKGGRVMRKKGQGEFRTRKPSEKRASLHGRTGG